MSYIILSGLIILIILPPIAVGSVYIVTYSAMEMMVFGLLLLHIWTSDFSSLKRESKVQGSRLKADNSTPNTQHSKQHYGSAIDVGNSKLSPRGMNSSFDSTGQETQNSKLFTDNYMRKTLLLMLPLFIFLACALFQLIPLPLSAVSIISPQAAALYEKLGLSLNTQHSTLNTFQLYPLTLSVHSSTTALLKWCTYVGAFFLAATFMPVRGGLERGKWIKALLIAVFLVGFAEAVYGLYLCLNHSDALLWFKRKYSLTFVNGTYINKNHFAGLMNMSIFVSLGVLGSHLATLKMRGINLRDTIIKVAMARKTPFLYFLLFGIITMLLALVFSNSRMGQFSFLGGFCSLCLLYVIRRSKTSILILMVIICLSLLWAGWKGLNPVINRWNAAEEEFQGRADIWESTKKLIRNYSLSGTGIGTFELAYPPYKPPKFGAAILDHAHNDYLEVLSEMGFIGFICWIAFFFIYLYCVFIAWFKRHDTFARGIGAVGIAATISMLVHSLADFNLQMPANALLLFIIMGLTWRTVNSSFTR